MKIFDFIIELIGWIRIVASPLFAGLAIGAIVYLNKKDNVGLAIGIIIAVIGLVIGLVFATRVWKKQGTNHFLSRIMSTPRSDKKDDTR